MTETPEQIAARCKTLEELKQAVKAFKGCELNQRCKKTVFGRGSPTFGMMVIGEAPGIEEDTQGKPSVGESAKLLDAMLRTINCESAYHANMLYWRPPGNRQPLPEELAICKPFLEKQIELVAPRVLILCGSTAAKLVVNTPGTPIFTMRNASYSYKGIRTFVTFHPAYILRKPELKADWMLDFIKIEGVWRG